MCKSSHWICFAFSFVNRTCTKACEIGGVRFEPGVQVGIPIWNIHHDEQLWPQPYEFKPERYKHHSTNDKGIWQN